MKVFSFSFYHSTIRDAPRNWWFKPAFFELAMHFVDMGGKIWAGKYGSENMDRKSGAFKKNGIFSSLSMIVIRPVLLRITSPRTGYAVKDL